MRPHTTFAALRGEGNTGRWMHCLFVKAAEPKPLKPMPGALPFRRLSRKQAGTKPPATAAKMRTPQWGGQHPPFTGILYPTSTKMPSARRLLLSHPSPLLCQFPRCSAADNWRVGSGRGHGEATEDDAWGGNGSLAVPVMASLLGTGMLQKKKS